MQSQRSCAPAAGPVTDWRRQGACLEVDPELFFGPDGESPAARRAREDAARTVCVRCPVVSVCLSLSLDARMPFGVWGGLGEDERQGLLTAGAEVAS